MLVAAAFFAALNQILILDWWWVGPMTFEGGSRS